MNKILPVIGAISTVVMFGTPIVLILWVIIASI